MHDEGRAREVALCIDEESQRRPELIGLVGEALEAQPWLSLFSSGSAMRESLKRSDISCEAWIAASDDVDPINLAAAVKRDRQDRTVVLVSAEGTGSLRSRANCAGIDAVIGVAELAARYAAKKRSFVEARCSLERLAPADPLDPALRRKSPVKPEGLGSPAFEGEDSGGGGQAAPAPRTSFVSSREPTTERAAFLLPVVSGSGGAGKSTMSVLAATMAQRCGFRTVLVDLDLQFGDVLALIGRDDALRVDEVVSSPASLERIRPDGPMPAVIGAPRRLEQAEAVAPGVGWLLDALKTSYEVIVANTGSFWAEQHAVLLERSSAALFLVDQRPSSLRACQHALELCARCSIATGPFVFAANRCSRGALYTSLDVSCALRGARTVELFDGGSEVEELLAAGQPLDLVESGNALCESLEELLSSIVPGWEDRVPAARGASLPRRLFGRRLRRGRAACL